MQNVRPYKREKTIGKAENEHKEDINKFVIEKIKVRELPKSLSNNLIDN